MGFTFFGAGIIAPAWQDLIAHTFAPTERGRFFGITTFLGTSLGALGGFGASRVLAAYAFPFDFAIAFGFAAFCVQISSVFLALTREPVRLRPAAQPERARPIAGATVDTIRRDPEFARFLLIRTLMGLGTMGFGFVAVHTTQAFGVPDATVGLFTVLLLVGEASGNISSGAIADRVGHRLPLLLGVGSVTLAFVIARFAGVVGWYYPAFLLMGYAIGGLVAPLIGGGLASASHQLLFAVTAVINLIVWIGLLVLVRDPRRRVGSRLR